MRTVTSSLEAIRVYSMQFNTGSNNQGNVAEFKLSDKKKKKESIDFEAILEAKIEEFQAS